MSTGWFGIRQSFVPLARAELGPDGLRAPYRRDQVKCAPAIDPDAAHGDPEQGAELYRHHGFGAPHRNEADQDGPMTRSEERLRGPPRGDRPDASRTG